MEVDGKGGGYAEGGDDAVFKSLTRTREDPVVKARRYVVSRHSLK